MKGKEKRKKSGGRKERSIRGGVALQVLRESEGGGIISFSVPSQQREIERESSWGEGWRGRGGERNASLKWDNKCARHERTEHTLILRELLYLCTHTYTWGMSKRE